MQSRLAQARRRGNRWLARRSLTAMSRPASSRHRPRQLTLRDGREVELRPVAASDAAELLQSFARLSADARYQRFMQHKKDLDRVALGRGVRPVAGEEFAYVATVPAADGFDIVGAARYVRAEPAPDAATDATPDSCEFAVTVGDDWRRSGLARQLLANLVRRARRDGYRTIEGQVLADNEPMLALARRMRFKVERQPGEGSVVRIVRELCTPVRGSRRRP